MSPKGKGNPDEIALDFSGVKPFEPMNPNKIYKCQVSKFASGTAQSSGGPKVSAELTILGPEETEVVDINGVVKEDKNGKPMTTRAAGRKLFREFSLKSEALPFLHEFIRAVDPEAELGADFTLKPKDYVGLECAVKIQNELFDEQIRARVKRILPVTAYKEA